MISDKQAGMGMGATRDALRDDDVAPAANDGSATVDAAEADAAAERAWAADRTDAAPPDDRWRRLAAWACLLLAACWIFYMTGAAIGLVPPPAPGLVATIGVALTPLAVALLVYLVVARGGRAETGRLARVTAAMRRENAGLETMLAHINTVLADHNRLIAEQAAQLVTLGETAAGRLDAVRAGFAQDAALMTGHATMLGKATDAARTDLGVILADMPRIDAQVRDLAVRLREAGLGAHEQAGALDAQLVAITAHARDADDVANGATQRLAAHLARIEGVSDVAAERIDAAGVRMAAVAEQSLDQAVRMLDDLSRGLAAEQATLTAIVGESQALIGTTGSDALAAARAQLDLMDTRLAGFADRAAREGSALHVLAETLGGDLDRADERFERLGQAGGGITLHLIETLDRARAQADATTAAVDGSGGAVDRLIVRADRLTRAMELIGTALQGADYATTRIVARVDKSLPALNGFADTAGHAGDALDRAGEAIDRNQIALVALGAAVAQTDADMQALAATATPALDDALVHIRAAADTAADHVRTALAAIGPDAASGLAAAVGDIVDTGVSAGVAANLARLSSVAEDATAAAAAASDRLERQLATIAETAAVVDARIAETRQEAAAADEADFSHRVALLIESLNSTSIDMTRILASEVGDDSWAAYLRGDRGVFTRRAVRLLDTADARTIAAHYRDDRDFHDRVNRYVHDFEAMLRRVLANRDGTLMGVTLLSSDMGKLYVALAQAIERLRH